MTHANPKGVLFVFSRVHVRNHSSFSRLSDWLSSRTCKEDHLRCVDKDFPSAWWGSKWPRLLSDSFRWRKTSCVQIPFLPLSISLLLSLCLSISLERDFLPPAWRDHGVEKCNQKISRSGQSAIWLPDMIMGKKPEQGGNIRWWWRWGRRERRGRRTDGGQRWLLIRQKGGLEGIASRHGWRRDGRRDGRRRNLRNSIVGIWQGSQAVAVKPKTGGFRGVRKSVVDTPLVGQFRRGEVSTELPTNLLISFQ